MKTYTFSFDRNTLVPSTPTIVAFIQSAYDLKKNGTEVFSGLDIMKNALDKGLWSTKQHTDKKLMTTWAFYLKQMKSLGLTEHGSINEGKKFISMEDLMNSIEE